MNRASVATVYDRLLNFESAGRKQAYPIHKRLRLPAQQDIYDLVAQGVTLPKTGRILDAGCGTGFGTLKLAAKTGCAAHGISLSAAEVAYAQAHAVQAGHGHRVSFSVSSFDDDLESSYDLIVAVESLKHSANLSTMRCLFETLRPGGTLIVVDDVLVDDANPSRLDRLKSAWALSSVYREHEFRTALAPRFPASTDLTHLVQRRSTANLWLRHAVLNAASLLRPRNQAVHNIFRAGLDLESLYRQGCMRYLMMSWRS